MKNSEITEKIRIWGIVQGVGFRPFAAKLADRMGMKGEVLNIGGLVDITLTDTEERIENFIKRIMEEKPLPAEIVHMKTERLDYQFFESFSILDSDAGDDEAAMIPADLAMCSDCLAEFHDSENSRYQHPFISCMVCGPRYTIIDRIPYDRENTVMDVFPMCEFCKEQYTDRDDRRYHAQTISCHDCGPMLEIKMQNGRADESVGWGEMPPLNIAATLIGRGEVIALKGVGGYNLVCDPFSVRAVCSLRQIKGREEKPFAVMFCDMEQVKRFCIASSVEEKLLQSSARPILLLERKEEKQLSKMAGGLLKGDASFEDIKKSRFIGSFLPSMGAQYLLLELCGHPLIVTSANLSDMPMIKDDAEMFALADKQSLVAAVIYNKRKITVRADDSVARVIDGQPQMIRRSKGYAPVPLYIGAESSQKAKLLSKEEMVFSAGGQLKNSFALSKGPFSYISQYFGDLDSTENEEIYIDNVARMEEFFRIRPAAAVCDLHPLYFTTRFASAYADKRGIPLIKVQHHHAHIASVMAEHGIPGPIIGVSFDGTGYGTDGTIWGGEFLICEGRNFERIAHLETVKMLGGDSSMREGWKSAMCYVHAQECRTLGKESDRCRGAAPSELKATEKNVHFDLSEIIEYSNIKDNSSWPVVRAALENNVNCISSSSMGRLFDAVAALLGIQDVNRYEGECAIALEDAAAAAMKNPGESRRNDLALKFHLDVAHLIIDQCMKLRDQRGINQVALTGGVFQNKILMEETLRRLRRLEFSVYYNISVSPGDGGICLGQNYIGMQYLMERKREAGETAW